MPHAFEFPWVLRAIVELMRGERRGGDVISELVALALRWAWLRRLSRGRSRLMPGLAAIIRALNDLSEPAAGLRRINTIRIGGRSLHVVNFPARKMRTTYFPLFALAIRRQHERAFVRTHQNPYLTHSLLLESYSPR